MKIIITYLSFIVLLTIIGVQSAFGQVNQLTYGESVVNDSNYEQFFEYNGAGCFASLIDDRVSLFTFDNELIYTTSFDLCEKAIVEWFIVGQEVIYVSNYEVTIESISGDFSEEYPYENSSIDYDSHTLRVGLNKEILVFTFFPNNEKFQFDITKRKFIEPEIVNIDYITNDYLYHSSGGFSGDGLFIRSNRNTLVQDTIFRNYTRSGSIRPVSDYHFFTSDELPVQLVYPNDDIVSYDFDHGSLSSGIITDNGKVVFAEYFTEGTIIYTLDESNANLISVDSIMSDNRISILDSYGDQLYVEYSQQFATDYGYIDFPYSTVNVITDELEYFDNFYLCQDSDIFIVEDYRNPYIRNITLVEQESNEVHNFKVATRSLWLEDPLEILSTPQGVYFIASKDQGKVLYEYNTESNTLNLIRSIDNARGLGTNVVKNDDGYLISQELSLFGEFEYIHPVTLELRIHNVDGVIHGNVIPWEGKYFYIRNQNYNDVDEDFVLDFIMFDPYSDEISIIENDFSYPMNNVSFSNINFGYGENGFVKIYNTSLIFDLRNESVLFADSETKTLLDNIYHETDNYFYSNIGQKNYRISKSNFSNRSLIFEGQSPEVLIVNEKSFVARSSSVFHFVEEDKVSTINPALSSTPNFSRVINGKLFFGTYNGVQSVGTMVDLASLSETPLVFEGYMFQFIDDHIVSLNTFEPPYELVSSRISTGDKFTKTIDREFQLLHAGSDALYILDNESLDISVYDSEWQEVDIIDGTALSGGTFELISDENVLPVLLELRKPRITGQYYNLPDYELVILDPLHNTLETYFACSDDYRFHKVLSLDSVSYVLLRTKEDGYQVCEFEIPNYINTSAIQQNDLQSTAPLLFPNPTNGIINLSRKFEEVSVYDNIGRMVLTRSNTSIIDLSEYDRGIYFIRVKQGNHKYSIVKAVRM